MNFLQKKNDFSKIFIIILNHNEKEGLLRTLASVFGLKYDNFEVVLVDNDSTDGSLEEIRRSFSRVIVIKNSENVGVYTGLNIGIKYSLERGAKYVMFLKAGAILNSNSLSGLAKELDENNKIGIVSPVIINEKRTILFSGGKISWGKMSIINKKTKLKSSFFSDFILRNAALVRAEVFRKSGLLDEKYFLYYGDVDFSLQVKKAGYTLLISDREQVMQLECKQKEIKNREYWLAFSNLFFFKKNTPFYWRIWTESFLMWQRMKNWIDIKFYKKESAKKKAQIYKDFYVSK